MLAADWREEPSRGWAFDTGHGTNDARDCRPSQDHQREEEEEGWRSDGTGARFERPGIVWVFSFQILATRAKMMDGGV